MIKIIAVDDSLAALTRITNHVKSLKGYELMSTANDGYGLIRFCSEQKVLPDIVLLDILMPKIDGVAAMEYMRLSFPTVKVIALSSFDTNEMISDMLACGAWGYVFKGEMHEILADALQSVSTGQPYVDERLRFDVSVRPTLMQKRNHHRESMQKQFELTSREIAIITLTASNINYPEMSAILNISPKTIENAIQTINTKMDISGGRQSLQIHCIRLGITKIMNQRAA
jgi:DNA-binding NarL/FixJ family response regulator